VPYFVRDADGIYRSDLLRQFDWLDHGFGGRHSVGWPPERHASLVQVHGATVIDAHQAGTLGEGDALTTSQPGLYVNVRTADCLPLLIADVRQRKVAAVHAGWKGTVARIAVRTILALQSDPADVWVAIGPGIRPCCFEVGEEVAREFGSAGRSSVDLFAVNERQLVDIGVPARQIAADAPCTKCNPDEFHSFRRDKQDAGRMHSAISIR
jgi:YfiH family protein